MAADSNQLTLKEPHPTPTALREWQQALDFNSAVLASMRSRDASTWELAYIGYNDYGPLIRLGRLEDADRLLAHCQQVFEDHNDLDQLANVFTARASLENARGNVAGALVFERTAIRYAYLRREPEDVAIDHHNLAVPREREPKTLSSPASPAASTPAPSSSRTSPPSAS